MQMQSHNIWSSIKFDERWNSVKIEKFDIIYPSWEKRRVELQKNEEQYKRFMDQLKRKQAIDTGIIERINSPNSPMRDGVVYNYCPPEAA